MLYLTETYLNSLPNLYKNYLFINQNDLKTYPMLVPLLLYSITCEYINLIKISVVQIVQENCNTFFKSDFMVGDFLHTP